MHMTPFLTASKNCDAVQRTALLLLFLGLLTSVCTYGIIFQSRDFGIVKANPGINPGIVGIRKSAILLENVTIQK